MLQTVAKKPPPDRVASRNTEMPATEFSHKRQRSTTKGTTAPKEDEGRRRAAKRRRSPNDPWHVLSVSLTPLSVPHQRRNETAAFLWSRKPLTFLWLCLFFFILFTPFLPSCLFCSSSFYPSGCAVLVPRTTRTPEVVTRKQSQSAVDGC